MLITYRREDDHTKFFLGNKYVAWLGHDGEFRRIINNASVFVGLEYTLQDARSWLQKEFKK